MDNELITSDVNERLGKFFALEQGLTLEEIETGACLLADFCSLVDEFDQRLNQDPLSFEHLHEEPDSD